MAAENCGTYGGRLALGDENDLLPLPMVVDVVLVVLALLAGDMTRWVAAKALALGASDPMPSSCAFVSFDIGMPVPGVEPDISQVKLGRDSSFAGIVEAVASNCQLGCSPITAL